MTTKDWFTITKINEQTYAISELGHWEKVHSFLLIGKDGAFLIDTGLGIDSITRVVKSLTNLPITVLTTHVHTDHIGNHKEFGKIAVHEQEVAWLENGIPDLPIGNIKNNLIRDITQPLPKSFNIDKYKVYTGKPNIVLHDYDELDVGERKVRILHTPGHSPGHVAILDLKYDYLFSGDLLYLDTPIYAFYPSTNPKLLLNSLERISNLEGLTKIFGSHNTLGLDPSILSDVKNAIKYLRENNLDHFGTGLHTFNQISFKF